MSETTKRIFAVPLFFATVFLIVLGLAALDVYAWARRHSPFASDNEN